MAAHITYLSEAALHRKFGRALQDRAGVTYGFDADFQVESYLRYQGISFVDRFDANSYLYITRAMDYFDLAASYDGVLANAFRGCSTRFCVISFSSDWLFPTAESRELVRALTAVAANVSFCEIETDRGHDAFLLDEPEFHRVLAGFLDGAASSVRAALIRAMAVAATLNGLRPDLRLIANLVEPNTRVLDVGCSDGALLAFLARTKQVDARGIELSQAGVHECVSRGLAVVQGDADTDLADLPGRLVRLRDPEPDHPGDAQPAAGPGEHAAHRPLRHRVVHQLRLLACALAPDAAWPHAERALPAGAVVCHLEHPPVHARGFRAAVPRARTEHPHAHLSRRQRRSRASSRAITRWSNLLSEQALFLLARPGSRSAA